jgi:hypothetical protein
MTYNPTEVLQRHRELSHGFALIAPLGGGAIVALQELQQTDSDGGSSLAARDQGWTAPMGMGALAAALRFRLRGCLANARL